jgi:hypothetical protein
VRARRKKSKKIINNKDEVAPKRGRYSQLIDADGIDYLTYEGTFICHLSDALYFNRPANPCDFGIGLITIFLPKMPTKGVKNIIFDEKVHFFVLSVKFSIQATQVTTLYLSDQLVEELSLVLKTDILWF